MEKIESKTKPELVLMADTIEAKREYEAYLKLISDSNEYLAKAIEPQLQFKTFEAVVGSGESKRKVFAVIDVAGYINPSFHFPPLATSVSVLIQGIKKLQAQEDVDTIVLNISSGGGSVFYLEELSDVLFNARQNKNIIAIANPAALSAAYWIATGAEKLYSTPSGLTGSVGVVMVHGEYSKYLEKEGVKVTVVKAGENKWDANPYEALSKKAQERLQFEVDTIYSKFISHVARNRSRSEDDVKKNFGGGHSFFAEEAYSAGMIDGILTLEDALAERVLELNQIEANDFKLQMQSLNSFKFLQEHK